MESPQGQEMKEESHKGTNGVKQQPSPPREPCWQPPISQSFDLAHGQLPASPTHAAQNGPALTCAFGAEENMA